MATLQEICDGFNEQLAKGAAEYRIGSRMVRYRSLKDLLDARDRCTAETERVAGIRPVVSLAQIDRPTL